jgi:hypothetical protein
MKGRLNSIILGGLLFYSPVGLAAEAWIEVSGASSRDRVLVDRNSIQRTGNQVDYWEYRDVRQSRLGSTGASAPIYGMMIYRSVDCLARTSRMQRLVLFNQNREVIRRVSYEEIGGLARPVVGNNMEASFRYVCEQENLSGEGDPG